MVIPNIGVGKLNKSLSSISIFFGSQWCLSPIWGLARVEQKLPLQGPLVSRSALNIVITLGPSKGCQRDGKGYPLGFIHHPLEGDIPFIQTKFRHGFPAGGVLPGLVLRC